VYNPKLASFWDKGVCGKAPDNHNFAWCINQDSKSPYECAGEVSVDTKLCGTGAAVLNFTHRFAWIDGCAFAYYAQYACKVGTD